jgi:hypothetical protein
MILFLLNHNDEKWPHTRRIEIAGRNRILPPLRIAWKTNKQVTIFNIENSQKGIKIEC